MFALVHQSLSNMSKSKHDVRLMATFILVDSPTCDVGSDYAQASTIFEFGFSHCFATLILEARCYGAGGKFSSSASNLFDYV